jgi:hypothetical protein
LEITLYRRIIVAEITTNKLAPIRYKQSNGWGMHIRATEEWYSWLDEACAKTERTRVEFIARGVAVLAEKEGLPPPPVRRPTKSRTMQE